MAVKRYLLTLALETLIPSSHPWLPLNLFTSSTVYRTGSETNRHCCQLCNRLIIQGGKKQSSNKQTNKQKSGL